MPGAYCTLLQERHPPIALTLPSPAPPLQTALPTSLASCQNFLFNEVFLSSVLNLPNSTKIKIHLLKMLNGGSLLTGLLLLRLDRGQRPRPTVSIPPGY